MKDKSDKSIKPFRFLDLPIELQLQLIKTITQISISTSISEQQNTLLNEVQHELDWDEGLPLTIDWTTLKNLSLTCKSINQITKPNYQRRLIISLNKSKSIDLYTVCQNHLNYNKALSNVTTLYYRGLKNGSHTRNSLSHSIPQTIQITLNLLNQLISLKSLCLSHVEGNIVSSILSHPSTKLEALSLSYIIHKCSDLIEFDSLKNIKALKIQECNPIWLSIVKQTKNIEHLCIWMPAQRIRDIDWFEPDIILPKLRYLNLDGFRTTPKLLIQLCSKIKEYRGKGKNPLVIEELDLEAKFNKGLIEIVLETFKDYSLKSLAISCVSEFDMSPNFFHLIIQNGLSINLQKLLVMVEGYEGRKWPNSLESYANELSNFKSLKTFLFNHIEYDDEPIEDPEDPEEELVIIQNQERSITQNFQNHSNLFFNLLPNLSTVVLVKALWANRADGCKAFKNKKGDVEVLENLDLREMLIPFEPRWTD
ncbi:hypothetical protein CROQUDRAFT_54380 [Cronartium quercuum f. sp. fusiforme G11]|uniref:Uncharacterized protein n=1 Tax=Cronartium quercuum f. sp. fusiforme G11 TaxID=708437 RepID=A0A9P6T6Q8_9BASI|nr:hypothetical protein CROQUDRAFT_54380 [Cronartium quercuum f. sp. fusiforme G11]